MDQCVKYAANQIAITVIQASMMKNALELHNEE